VPMSKNAKRRRDAAAAATLRKRGAGVARDPHAPRRAMQSGDGVVRSLEQAPKGHARNSQVHVTDSEAALLRATNTTIDHGRALVSATHDLGDTRLGLREVRERLAATLKTQGKSDRLRSFKRRVEGSHRY
jgi:hypothetical protein